MLNAIAEEALSRNIKHIYHIDINFNTCIFLEHKDRVSIRIQKEKGTCWSGLG